MTCGRIRTFLWHLGLYPESRCPIHGVEMMAHGFKGSNRRYTCPMGCTYR